VATRPMISLLHPTARVVPSEAFPRGWRDAHDTWLSRADHPEQVEYVLAVHESRWEACNAQDVEDYKREYPENYLPGASADLVTEPDHGWYGFLRVKNSLRDCVVDQTNVAAAASSGQLLMGVQDDFFPPEHWDTLLLRARANHRMGILRMVKPPAIEDDECIILCSSDIRASAENDKALMIAGAETRKRYERHGYLLDPDFQSMFSDNWRAYQARTDEKAGLVSIIERLDIQFEHHHPIFGDNVMDDVYQLENRSVAYQQGAATLHQKMTGAKVIAICLPGEVFRNEWVGTMFQTIQQLGNLGYITAPHWCYTSNVYCTRIELAQGALDFRPKADYVFWADDDNLVTGEEIQMLIEDLEAHPELGGVVGWCWCDHNESEGTIAATWTMSVGRQRMPDYKCLRLSADDLHAAFAKSPLITSDDMAPDVFWSGFPCVLMRRSVLEQLTPQAFAPLILPVNYGFTGEDTAFFINAHKAGIKFGVDIRVKVPHVKWRAIEPQFVPGVKPKDKVVEMLESMNIDSRLSSAAD